MESLYTLYCVTFIFLLSADELQISPSREQFLDALEQSMVEIAPVLCDGAVHMEGSLTRLPKFADLDDMSDDEATPTP